MSFCSLTKGIIPKTIQLSEKVASVCLSVINPQLCVSVLVTQEKRHPRDKVISVYLSIETANPPERTKINPTNQNKENQVCPSTNGRKQSQFARVEIGELDYKRPVNRIESPQDESHIQSCFTLVQNTRSKHSLLNHKFAKLTITTLKTNH